MTAWLIAAVGLLLAVTMLGAWMSWTAGRLDRMHLRCEAARAALETALARRSRLALELAAGSLTDPASTLLVLDAATRTGPVAEMTGGGDAPPATQEEVDGDRWQAESDLSAVLRAVPPAEPPSPVWDELAEVARLVAMSRRIHNDLAATTAALRARRRVRWFRLAGHAPPTSTISFDDVY